MVKLTMQNMSLAEPLFHGQEETLLKSCLQGVMGDAWADNGSKPACARIILGDFCFFAGDSTGNAASSLVSNLPDGTAFSIMTPLDKGWDRLIEELYGDSASPRTRYAVKKDPGLFDRHKLTGFAKAVPQGYEIKPIDEPLYHSLKRESWSRDFVAQYPSWELFYQLGLGYVAMYAGEAVAGASSYSSYKEGIEIEIVTREDHRRRGLARVCAAHLILGCLEKGLYPSWDAANLESLALARQLGYQPGEPYQVYHVDRSNHVAAK